jgi:hypothetical protein
VAHRHIPYYEKAFRRYPSQIEAKPGNAPARRADERMRRIGFLRVGPPPATFIDGFRQGLRNLGFVEFCHS